MPVATLFSDTASTSEPEGVISGALLQEIRRRLKLHQHQLASKLGEDTNTYRSRENGRRALGHVAVHRLRRLKRDLVRLGGDAGLVRLLDTAIDVDLTINQILDGNYEHDEHPLATWVQTRAWHDLLAWGLVGRIPRALGGTTGATVRPRLAAADQTLLLHRLRTAAEQTHNRGDGPATLLRRQIYFVASWDTSATGKDWLERMESREFGRLRFADGWTPNWVAGRSLAVARAVAGDPEHLRYFIDHQLRDDEQEVANLNYWANWSGEDDRPALSDEFMKTADLGPWRGTELLRQLTDGLTAANAYVELTAHTIWALLQRRPWLLDDDPRITAALRRHASLLLDEPTRLAWQAQRDLDRIFCATAMRRNS